MTQHRFTISPQTKVGELLDAFPALEEVLIEISPVFAKLKNPILRKTVAKVATLQQAAVIGGMPVEELVNRLRIEAGLDLTSIEDVNSNWLSELPPEWFSSEKITDRFDATKMINAGESPMNEILHRAKYLKEDNILELVTPFVPAPVIEMLIGKGFQVWVKKSGSKSYTYFLKSMMFSE